jgi:GNAT superfamily N-acetyltransferase
MKNNPYLGNYSDESPEEECDALAMIESEYRKTGLGLPSCFEANIITFADDEQEARKYGAVEAQSEEGDVCYVIGALWSSGPEFIIFVVDNARGKGHAEDMVRAFIRQRRREERENDEPIACCTAYHPATIKICEKLGFKSEDGVDWALDEITYRSNPSDIYITATEDGFDIESDEPIKLNPIPRRSKPNPQSSEVVAQLEKVWPLKPALKEILLKYPREEGHAALVEVLRRHGVDEDDVRGVVRSVLAPLNRPPESRGRKHPLA